MFGIASLLDIGVQPAPPVLAWGSQISNRKASAQECRKLTLLVLGIFRQLSVLKSNDSDGLDRGLTNVQTASARRENADSPILRS